MITIKRRSFLQGLAAGIFGAIFGKQGYEAGLQHLEGEPVEVIAGKTSVDICNEAMEKTGEYPIGTRKVLPDGRIFRYCKHVELPGDLYY